MKMQLCLGLSSQFGIDNRSQLDLLKRVGFDAFFFTWNSNTNVKALVHYGHQLGIICQSMHAPFTKMADMWKDEDVSGEAVQELLHCVEECAENQIPILVCHVFIGFGPQSPNQTGIANFERVVKRAGELGVKIAFENTEGEDYLEALMSAFEKYEHVGFCWDTGHELCYNHGKDMMKKYGDRILCTHLNDNLGVKSHEGVITFHDDLHLLPFDGIADWHDIVERLNHYSFHDILTFELNTKSKPGRHENDIYDQMDITLYITEVYKRACRVATLKEKNRLKK